MMKLFLNHGIKLTLANLFGLVISMVLIVLGLLFFGSLLLVLILGNLIFAVIEYGINLFQYFTEHSFIDSMFYLFQSDNKFNNISSAFSITEHPLLTAASVFLLLCYGFYQLTIQSMMLGGLYGSAIQSIFKEKGVFGAYFSHSFRHLGKMMQLQLLLLILLIPFLILLVLFNIFLQALIESPNIIYFQASFSVIFMLIFFTLFLQSPILIMKENVSAFKAITLQFQILKKDLFAILFSGALFFASLFVIHGAFLLVFSFFLHLSGVSIIDFHFDQFSILSYLILAIGLMIWLPIIFPYSFTCSVLILVNQYKQRLHPLVSSSTELATNELENA